MYTPSNPHVEALLPWYCLDDIPVSGVGWNNKILPPAPLWQVLVAGFVSPVGNAIRSLFDPWIFTRFPRSFGVFFGGTERRFVEKIGSYRNPRYFIPSVDTSVCLNFKVGPRRTHYVTLSGRVPFNSFSLLPLRSESGKDEASLDLIWDRHSINSPMLPHSPILLREAPPVITAWLRHRSSLHHHSLTLPGQTLLDLQFFPLPPFF